MTLTQRGQRTWDSFFELFNECLTEFLIADTCRNTRLLVILKHDIIILVSCKTQTLADCHDKTLLSLCKFSVTFLNILKWKSVVSGETLVLKQWFSLDLIYNAKFFFFLQQPLSVSLDLTRVSNKRKQRKCFHLLSLFSCWNNMVGSTHRIFHAKFRNAAKSPKCVCNGYVGEAGFLQNCCRRVKLFISLWEACFCKLCDCLGTIRHTDQLSSPLLKREM